MKNKSKGKNGKIKKKLKKNKCALAGLALSACKHKKYKLLDKLIKTFKK